MMVRRWAVGLVGLLAVLGGTRHAPGQDAAQGKTAIPRLPIEAYALDNGLKVVLLRDPSTPRVTVCMAYHVGSKNERAGRTGFAHFFEHMMFRGTKNVPNYDIPLQETGAQSNAFTSEDMTVYFETVAAPYLERALYLEAERLAYLPTALDQAKFDTEREVVKNERRQSYENQPYGLAEETILAGLFPKGHPYSWSVIGSMKDLGAATLDDLRAFFAEYYQPGNACLCLVGDFDPAEARRLIAKYFDPLAAGPKPRRPEATKLPAVARRIEQTDDVTVPRVYLTWPGVAELDPDAPALEVLARVLTDGEASRLQRALVREQQVADEVSASSDTKAIGGLFTIDATAVPDVAIEKLEAAIDAELARLTAVPPTQAELDRVLAQYEKAFYDQLTSPLGRAVNLAIGAVQKGDPEFYRKDLERTRKVTVADLARVAKAYLTPERLVLVIRPGKDESAAVEAGPLPQPGDAVKVEPRQPGQADVDWSVLPGPSAPRPFTPPRVERFTLGNGVEVWFTPWRSLPLVSARLQVPAGTIDDAAAQAGLATLTATMATQGTRRRTAVELSEALGLLGVELSCGAGLEETTLGFGTLARNLDPALDLLAEVLTEPRFEAADFERERALQVAGLERGPDSPTWISSRAARALVYGPEHPLGQPAEGRVATVKRLTLADAQAFHRARYVPGGARLVVVGDVEIEALKRSLERALGGWKGEAPAARHTGPAAGIATTGRVVHLVDKPGAVQSVLVAGRPWRPRTDPTFAATVLGDRILGGDFLSRLNQNLRERNGYTYGARSGIRYRRDGSTWTASTSVRADVTGPALKELVGEIEGIAGGRPLGDEEITTARAAETRSWPEQFEDPRSIAGVLDDLAGLGLEPEVLTAYLPAVEGVEPAAIRAAMAQLAELPAIRLLVVGDRGEVEPQLRAAGFDRIVVVDPDGRPVQGQ